MLCVLFCHGSLLTCQVGEEVESQTHLRVHQELLTCTLPELLPLTVALLLQKQVERPHDHKIIVFFTTAKVTAYFAEFWTGKCRGGGAT